MMNEIVISAQNNTNVIQIVNLFQAVNNFSNVNQSERYTYPFSNYANWIEPAIIEVRVKGQTQYTQYTVEYVNGDSSTEGLAIALTQLGFGTWYVEYVGMNTTLYVYGGSIEFGTLTLPNM